MNKPYAELRLLMSRHGVNQPELGGWISCNAASVSKRLTNAIPFSIHEMWIISDHFKRITDSEVDISQDFAKWFPNPKTFSNMKEIRERLKQRRAG